MQFAGPDRLLAVVGGEVVRAHVDRGAVPAGGADRLECGALATPDAERAEPDAERAELVERERAVREALQNVLSAVGLDVVLGVGALLPRPGRRSPRRQSRVGGDGLPPTEGPGRGP